MTHSRVHTDRAATKTPGDGGARGSIPKLENLPAPLRAALDAAIDKGGKAPAILCVTEIAGYTDFVLLVSARNERQVSSITDAVSIAARAAGAKVLGVEGTGEHLWDLIDFDDFMVHVFFHPVRTHYDLESMWSDAPRVVLGLAPDIMDVSELEALALPDGLPVYRGDATFGGFDDEFGDSPPPRTVRVREPRTKPMTPADSIADGRLAFGHDGDFGGDDDDDLEDDDFDDEDDFDDVDDAADDLDDGENLPPSTDAATPEPADASTPAKPPVDTN